MNRFNQNAMEMDAEEFCRNSRLSKELFDVFFKDLTLFIRKPSRRSDISMKCKILVTLSFYATGSYQRIVRRNHDTVMSQQSVSRAINDFTTALHDKNILSKYIIFPQCVEERNIIKRKFYEKYHIPSVVGYIDSTHDMMMAILRPAQLEGRYFNGRHFHSRNVQIICDSDMNILSVGATFVGATHDNFILNQYPVRNILLDLRSRGEVTNLLGDSAYAQRNLRK